MGETVAPRSEHRQRLVEHVRRHGLRWTRQREVILDLFLAQDEHLTSEDLHRRVAEEDQTIGLSTVYRTLKLFVEAEIASERRFRDGVTRFEVRQTHHDHLICQRCGRIVEFENPEIEALQEGVARDHGFRLTSHRHELYGSCADCQKG